MRRVPLVAHLDLKGVQYRPEYYRHYFQELKRLGYSSVLVEYEDVFPFRSATVSVQPEVVWSREFFSEFLGHAAEAGVEIIPLQQCLGHLEYAFRRLENRCYAIQDDYLRDLNPFEPQAREWIKALLGEVLEAHPASRYVHLGMDEAWSFSKLCHARGRDPLEAFLEHLEMLCELCERHGKTPMIWSDMLEEHIAPENIERLASFRNRVVLVPWNYLAGSKTEVVIRFAGLRRSRQWVENPQNAPWETASLWAGCQDTEAWAPELKALVSEFQVSPYLMEPLFQAAVWKRMGFTVFGGAGASITQDRSVLPYYHWRAANIRLWKQVAERHQLDGVIVTQWLRSNSLAVPNIIPDVVWPILAQAGSADESARSFFPEVPEIDALLYKIGKCRESWTIEDELLQEMETYVVMEHAHEWRSLLLLVKLWKVHKTIERVNEQVGCYAGLGRRPESAWKKELNAIALARTQLAELRDELKEHLKKQYWGQALEEWFYKVFTLPGVTLDRLEATIEESVFQYHQRQAGIPFKAE